MYNRRLNLAMNGVENLNEDNESQSEKLILELLRDAGRPLTTREIQLEAEKARLQCPDSTIAFLNRMRIKGLVQGELSKDRNGWVWSVPR